MTDKKDSKLMERVVLGTAQLGSAYGIANKQGLLSQPMVNDVVQEAWAHGIRQFDTAQAYGNSEFLLGRSLERLGLSCDVKILSKLDPNLDHLSPRDISEAVDLSLERLCISEIYAILIHHEETLSMWDKGLGETMMKLVSEGKIKRIGISVSSPEKAKEALETDGIDIVQLPSSIFDQRFRNTGIFELAERKNKDIYIRSVFLQGLILMEPEDIPERMDFAKPVLKELREFCHKVNLSRQLVAVGYLRSNMPRAYLIFGAETPNQVKENARLLDSAFPESLSQEVETLFNRVDERILNPSLWPA